MMHGFHLNVISQGINPIERRPVIGGASKWIDVKSVTQLIVQMTSSLQFDNYVEVIAII